MSAEGGLDEIANSQWERIKARRIFANSTERSRDGDSQLSASQRLGVVPQSYLMEEENQKYMLALSGTDNFKHVEAGDYVISLRSFEGGFEYSAYTGCVSPAYTVLKAKRPINNTFWRYFFKSDVFKQVLAAFNVGIRDGKSIRYDDFGEIVLPIPNLEEQEEIASVLDRETARIDALIDRKTRFIELLREKRQALITHAVTKGLDPSVKLKESGVEWLGQVPEHWEVKRLKFIATVQTGVAKGKDNANKKTIEVPYLRVANVQDGYLDLDDIATIEIAEEDLPRYLLQCGDVLMNEGGDYDKLGRGHVWHCEIAPCIHQNHVFAVRPTKVLPEWLNTFTSSNAAQFYFMGRSKQSTNLASISSTNLMELPVPLPAAHEQKDVLQDLGYKTARMDTVIEKTERSIELLKERRAALITAAVTGQIDLREAAL